MLLGLKNGVVEGRSASQRVHSEKLVRDMAGTSSVFSQRTESGQGLDAYLWKPSSLMRALVTASFVSYVIPGRRPGHFVDGGGEGRGKSASRLLSPMMSQKFGGDDYRCRYAMGCR